MTPLREFLARETPENVVLTGAFLRFAICGVIKMGCEVHGKDQPLMERMQEAGYLKVDRLEAHYGPKEDALWLQPTPDTKAASQEIDGMDLKDLIAGQAYAGDSTYAMF